MAILVNQMFRIRSFNSAFRFEWNDGFVFNGESHSMWEAVFVEEGTVEVTEDERVYTLESGNMILHAPFEFHRIRSKNACSPAGYIVSFEIEGKVPDILSDGIFSIDGETREEYISMCQSLFPYFVHRDGENDSNVSESDVSSEFARYGIAVRFTSFLLRLASSGEKSTELSKGSAAEYRKIVSYIKSNVMRELSLSEIARENNVSVSYVKLLFKTYAGIPPKAYYSKLRAQCAEKLLRAGASVGEVADKLGFSSPGYFSVFYKRETGKLPSAEK